MRRTAAGVFVILTIVMMAGCGATRPSKYYSLELPASSPSADNHASVTLLVGHIRAAHLYREDRIVFRKGGIQMGTYESHRWAEPPTEMLEEMLVHLLRFSGKYRSVQPLRSNARGDFILRGRLHNFEEVSDGTLAARLAFELELYEQKTGTTVWTHFYSHDEPVNGKDVPAVVETLNRNVQRGLEEVAAGLDRYFASHPPQ